MTWRRMFTDKRHLIWPLALAVVANVALLILVLYPLSQKVSGGEKQAEAASAQLNSARKEHARARATVAGKQTADDALQQFYSSILPPDLSGARRGLTKIDQMLSRSNLRRERNSMRPTEMRDSHLAKLTAVVYFSGNYADVRRFIYALETSPEFMVIENMELIQEAEGKSALKVTAQIATYYRAVGDGN
jgi:Tfp pilus assembly protein PilO